MLEFMEKLELIRFCLWSVTDSSTRIRRSWWLCKVWRVFRCAWQILEPGTLMKHERLSDRAGSVRDVDNGNSGTERSGPPLGGPVCSIWKNIVLPCSGPMDLHYRKNGYFQWTRHECIGCPSGPWQFAGPEAAADLAAGPPPAAGPESGRAVSKLEKHLFTLLNYSSRNYQGEGQL